MALTAGWLITWRLVFDTPWGFHPSIAPGGLTNVGIVSYPGDTWSYLSWVQQYYHGSNLAGLIYTTEPHAALLWLFPLWSIGRVAALLHLPVMGCYNAATVVGAVLSVLFLRRAATALRMGSSARDWATVALVLGSGGSWLWHVANKLGLASAANGGDQYFTDMFPSTALVSFGYHAIGLAILTCLWWTTNRLEDALASRAAATKWAVVTAFVGGLLAFSRPYEPIAFLCAWGLKAAWDWLARKRYPEDWKASGSVCALLGLALLPGIGWTLWVSRQPVWSTFANESLALGIPRTAWLWTLAGWTVLAWVGFASASHLENRKARLPLAASALLGLIVLGLGAGHTKLASGLIIGPILLSGFAAETILRRLSRQSTPVQVGIGVILLATLLGIPSLFLNFLTIKLRGPALVNTELLTLSDNLAFTGGRPPLVLTDAATGAMLPGLIGCRVWVGHWSLSPHFKGKSEQVKAAGLDPDNIPNNAIEANAVLEKILSDAPFDFALIDSRCRQVEANLLRKGWRIAGSTPSELLLKAPSY